MNKIEAEVSGLYFYPIKSCSGTELQMAEISERGFIYDRHWMVVNQNGLFLTQRELPRMALIKPSLEKDRITVSIMNSPSLPLELPVDNDGLRREVEIWGSRCQAVDDGDISAQWFSDFLGRSCRLVHMPGDFVREKRQGYGRLEFADSYPLLIVSEGSLQDLNKKIQDNGGEPVPMDRFRPNIIVKGCQPYAEDSWKRIRINKVRFDVVKPCIRCPIPQVDQKTATIKSGEPAKTLLGYRRVSRTEIIFAQNAINLDTGQIQLGDNIEIFERKDPPFFDSVA